MLSLLDELKGPITNGLLLGGLYGMIGIGMSMIFGIVRLVNLAHGDLVILASYLSLVTMTLFPVDPMFTLVIVIPAMCMIGFAVQYYLLNPVLGKGMNPPLLVAFGLSIILQNLLLLIFTPDARTLFTSISVKTIPLGGFLNIPLVYLVDFVGSVVMIALLRQLFRRTYLGKAIKAASDDEGAAQLMGINTKTIYAFAMAIAMGTAGVAGVSVGITFTFYPHTGPEYLIIAFGVVILGGLGSLLGTFLGGLILGLAQLLGAHFLGPGFQLLSGYLILLIVLTFKPTGLFAKGQGER
jgi:branched-chain amino acid transport system permease protein